MKYKKVEFKLGSFKYRLPNQAEAMKITTEMFSSKIETDHDAMMVIKSHIEPLIKDVVLNIGKKKLTKAKDLLENINVFVMGEVTLILNEIYSAMFVIEEKKRPSKK